MRLLFTLIWVEMVTFKKIHRKASSSLNFKTVTALFLFLSPDYDTTLI